jgi:hypothetical protein
MSFIGHTYRFLILSVVLTLGLAACDSPITPVDWSKNYNTKKKSPFGLYVLDQEIENMYYGFKKVERVNKKISDYLYDNAYSFEYAMDENKNSTFFYIDDTSKLYPSTINAVLDEFVFYGNQAFVSVNKMPETWFADMGIEMVQMNSYHRSASYSLTSSNKKFSMDLLNNIEYFVLPDEDWIMPLGYVEPFGSEGKLYCNFFAYNYGEGIVFLHASPEMFSNYSFLKMNNGDYVSGVLSNLHRNKLLWFNNYKRDRNEQEYSLLSYIMSQPALKAAWYMLWLIALLFVLMKAKRVQRIIPVFLRKRNYSVDYTKRMSQFHLLEKNYHGLIETQILLILDKLRNEHRIDTSQIDDSFAEKMHNATNCNIYAAQEFVRYLKKQRSRSVAFDFDFEELKRIVNKLNLK